MGMTYEALYLWARDELLRTEEPQYAGSAARDLVCTLSHKTTEQFLLNRNEELPGDICEQVIKGVRRLQNGEPLPYILGEWEFYGLPMYVSHDVLIPRDDTCAVTELAIGCGLFMDRTPRILDLCTGSGCIGIAIASRLKDARVTLADISREAAAVARKNILLNKLGGRVSCVQLDARQTPPDFLGKFDMIVSNPPYVTTQEMLELPASVSDFEPHLALHGGDDGLLFYRDIVRNFASVIKPNGFICFEFGMGQGDAVCDILIRGGFEIQERKKDYNGIERAVMAQFIVKGD